MCETAKNDSTKKMDGNGLKFNRNPKHFLTWSTSTANSRLQKMSKTLANNITRLQLKMEKAIPFHQGLGAGSSSASGKVESNELCCNHDLDNNNGHNLSVSPDVVNVNVSKLNLPSCGPSNTDKMVKETTGRHHYDSRIQSARIVLSHPSVSQSHSQGSVANPDKIIQINIDSYKAYSPEEVDCLTEQVDNSRVTSVDFNVQSGTMDDTQNKKSDKILGMQLQPLDLFYYDSGTGSANTSISGSSLSSPSVSSMEWSRATEVSALSPNLNSSPPSSFLSKKRGHDSRNYKRESTHFPGILKKINNACAVKKEVVAQDSNNSTNNSGASIIESTDETTLLIENNKSSHKRGLRNGGTTGKNVVICNKKNSVRNTNLESPLATSTPLSLKSLISQVFPPSKLAVTIFEKEGELRHAPWFQPSIPREKCLEILRKESIGSFIVRESSTKSGCFALSLRVPKEYQPCGIAHYLILKTSRGYKIKGFVKEFLNLSSLITHHSVMSELLPCPLSLHQYQTGPKSLRVSRANSSDFMEPEKLFLGSFTNF